jgi:hypothetical protein
MSDFFDLLQCVECGTWFSLFGPRTDKCRVCIGDEQLAFYQSLQAISPYRRSALRCHGAITGRLSKYRGHKMDTEV